MNHTAQIVIENATPTFDKAYSYLIPETLLETALPGARVRVPFGRGNRKRTGFILSLSSQSQTKGFKYIAQVLDTPPILQEEGLLLLAHLRETTFCTWFDALRLLIPAGLGITPKISYKLGEVEPEKKTKDTDVTDNPEQEEITKSEEILAYLSARGRSIGEDTFYKNLDIPPDHAALQELLKSGKVVQIQELRQRILDDKVTMISVIEEATAGVTPRQQEVLDFLYEEAPVSLKEASYYTGASRSVLHALQDKGRIEFYEVVRSRGKYAHAEKGDAPPATLSSEQFQVYQGLAEQMNQEQPNPALLYGVTGSGKTQVFVKLVEDAIAQGKTAIVMVPEISLTSQTVTTLQNRFGNQVAVLHSGLSLGERMDEWRRIRHGKAPVVVGTRSAAFAPLKNIGIIVIDEEQEHTYKSDQSPRYHAREISLLRCRYHKALLLLSSATPAVESYYQGGKERYTLYTLPHRFGKAVLPEVFLVDMGNTHEISNSLHFSNMLLEELYYNIERSEQSILLLNRRGYSTLVKCSSCGSPAECPHCSVSLTYHAANDSLVCHYCGYGQKRMSSCPTCDSEFIRYQGIGTQKLEEDLNAFFPQARILRMDMDTTMARDSHEEMFQSFREEKYDILIGTQMVAKGLNFPKVTLVGVLAADQALFADDFRSYERSFSLLTQVVGRSGRGEHPGRAIIQTYTPDHPIIEMASNQDYPRFYQEEITSRRLHLYPPFCTLAGFGFIGKDHKDTQSAAFSFGEEFTRQAREKYRHLPLRVLGPSPGEVLKVAEKYRYKLLVKCRNHKETRDFFREMLVWFYKNNKSVSIIIDMYYQRM